MAARRCLMAVLPHPDDESVVESGSLARYAAAGVRTVLVVCTGGEVGETSDPALATAGCGGNGGSAPAGAPRQQARRRPDQILGRPSISG